MAGRGFSAGKEMAMSNTIGYPTQYSEYSNERVLSLFSTASWNGMSYEQRKDACQEVANRYAEANGAPAPRVTTRPMVGTDYGYELGNIITLNEHLVRDGVFKTEDVNENGKNILVDVPVKAANWNVLETVFHEGTHGLQESQNRMANTYIDPDQDYDLYRIQGNEKEAFAAGQYNTLRAVDLVQRTTGQPDPNANDYYTSVRNESFREALQNAALHYNEPNVEAVLNQVIYDRDHGIQQTNPSPSYTAINALCDQYDLQNGQQQAGNTMTASAGPLVGQEGGTQPGAAQSAEGGLHTEQAGGAVSGSGVEEDDGGTLSATYSDSGLGLANDGGSLPFDGQDIAGSTEDVDLTNDGGSLDDYDADGDGQDDGGQEPD